MPAYFRAPARSRPSSSRFPAQHGSSHAPSGDRGFDPLRNTAALMAARRHGGPPGRGSALATDLPRRKDAATLRFAAPGVQRARICVPPACPQVPRLVVAARAGQSPGTGARDRLETGIAARTARSRRRSFGDVVCACTKRRAGGRRESVRPGTHVNSVGTTRGTRATARPSPPRYRDRVARRHDGAASWWIQRSPLAHPRRLIDAAHIHASSGSSCRRPSRTRRCRQITLTVRRGRGGGRRGCRTDPRLARERGVGRTIEI